jgi:hypothetical protein
MTQVTVSLSLPDELAQQAQQAGLLAPESIEQWLRDRLLSLEAERQSKIDAMFAEIDRIAAIPGSKPMSMDEITAEVKAVRAERYARGLR